MTAISRNRGWGARDPLSFGPLVAVAPIGHRLNGLSSIVPPDIAGEPLIALSPEPPVRQRIKTLSQRLAFLWKSGMKSSLRPPSARLCAPVPVSASSIRLPRMNGEAANSCRCLFSREFRFSITGCFPRAEPDRAFGSSRDPVRRAWRTGDVWANDSTQANGNQRIGQRHASSLLNQVCKNACRLKFYVQVIMQIRTRCVCLSSIRSPTRPRA